MVGQTIARYRVLEKAGEGGMGVVYKAHDPDLNRTVAIKVLSAAGDEERRRRFRQEARNASSLNHPNILTVYEAITVDGRQYLVTEYIDGFTLREWVKRKQPSLRQVLEVITPIADALGCAHEAGIVHRDLKPENILVSRQGHAKLADFGLAKLLDPAPGIDENTQTVDAVNTLPGVVVGTLPYLSPEQISGKSADTRSDIFSFGSVLYETLSGHRPFAGKSDHELLLAILHKDPAALNDLRPDLPQAVCAIVEKALEKDPSDRYQSMREMEVDLKRAQRARTSEASLVAAPRMRVFRPRVLVTIAFAFAVFVAVASWLLTRSDVFWQNPLANARFTKLTDFEGSELEATISPDGKFVTFLSDRDGSFDVWVGQVGSGAFINLTKGHPSAIIHPTKRSLGFSRDSSQLWFYGRDGPSAGVTLMPTLGGPGKLARGMENLLWTDRGRILYFRFDAEQGGDVIYSAELDGSNARSILGPERGVHRHYLTLSPDERWIYFVNGFPPDRTDIWRAAVEEGKAERVTSHNGRVSHPALLDDRTLVYTAVAPDGSGPWLYEMDMRRRVARRISSGVERYLSITASRPAAGQTPRLAATVANPSGNLWTLPITGSAVEETAVKRFPVSTARAIGPRLGPDFLIYLASASGSDSLWKWKDGVATEIWKPTDGAITEPAAISPDGRLITFTVTHGGRNSLHLINSDGTEVRALAPSLLVHGTASWSPDGKWIAIAGDAGQGVRLWKIPVPNGEPSVLIDKPAYNPVWSPDGGIIVYEAEIGLAGTSRVLKAITSRGEAFSLPEPPILVRLGSDHCRFVPGTNSLVLAIPPGYPGQPQRGDLRGQEFWLLALDTRRLTQLGRSHTVFAMKGFDVTPDGKQILFDRIRENSDVVLIDLPK
jgi:serine/threonine protein kinase